MARLDARAPDEGEGVDAHLKPRSDDAEGVHPSDRATTWRFEDYERDAAWAHRIAT